MSVNSKAKMEHHRSGVLTNEENSVLFGMLGHRCITLATAVVQVYLADAPSNFKKWEKYCTGVCAFVKDSSKKSYFIRVYDLTAKRMVWGQEMYNSFEYLQPRKFFHAFEADECVAGLNFAELSEASHFANVVNGKLNERKRKRTERRKTQHRPVSTSNSSIGNISSPTGMAQPVAISAVDPGRADPYKGNGGGGKSSGNKAKKDKGKKPKLNKDDIGQPLDFRHVGHIGYDPSTGFDMGQIDDDVKAIFKQAGVTDEQLEDDNTRQLIYDIIETHGGIDQIKKEARRPSSAVPTRPLPSAPKGGGAPPPPPPPTMSHKAGAPPPPSGPPLPSRHGRSMEPPPPPPASNRMSRPSAPAAAPPPPPPGPPRGGAGSRAPPPPPNAAPAPPPPAPPGAGGPPPPPPPPPPPIAGGGTGGIPPPPKPPGGGDGGGGGRGALLDQIQGGTALKKVTPNAERPVSGEGGGRNDLLSAIRQGVNLKAHATSDEPTSAAAPATGIAAALQSALANRSNALRGRDSDDSDDDDSFDDDEWD